MAERDSDDAPDEQESGAAGPRKVRSRLRHRHVPAGEARPPWFHVSATDVGTRSLMAAVGAAAVALAVEEEAARVASGVRPRRPAGWRPGSPRRLRNRVRTPRLP